MCFIVEPVVSESKMGRQNLIEKYKKLVGIPSAGATLNKCWFKSPGPWSHTFTAKVADHEKIIVPSSKWYLLATDSPLFRGVSAVTPPFISLILMTGIPARDRSDGLNA
ncbi:hypothetical protein D3C84_960930 [compost metagenome]